MNCASDDLPLWVSYLGLGLFLFGYAVLALFVAWRLQYIVDEFEKESRKGTSRVGPQMNNSATSVLPCGGDGPMLRRGSEPSDSDVPEPDPELTAGVKL